MRKLLDLLPGLNLKWSLMRVTSVLQIIGVMEKNQDHKHQYIWRGYDNIDATVQRFNIADSWETSEYSSTRILGQRLIALLRS